MGSLRMIARCSILRTSEFEQSQDSRALPHRLGVRTCLFDFVYGFSALLFTYGDEINDYQHANKSKQKLWINEQLGLFTFANSGSCFSKSTSLLALGWSVGYRFLLEMVVL